MEKSEMTDQKLKTETVALAADIVRLRAPNAGPMTFTGTNTYLIGKGARAVIDPGPNDMDHLNAILGALPEGETISHIFVTHAHLDHSPLARPLAEATGAKIYAFGTATAGRSQIMQHLAARNAEAGDNSLGGGEGVDAAFAPDITLTCGETIITSTWALTAHHTPGHFCNHLSFTLNDVAFTGDHIMGWSSTLISPPDGDLGDYFDSLRKIRAIAPRICYPGHGDPVFDPILKIDELHAHREMRSAQILEVIKVGPATAQTIAAQLYSAIPPQLLPAATRNTLAHLIELAHKNKISYAKPLHLLTQFHLP
jgi:hydroxyacylglutathione hydrolase